MLSELPDTLERTRQELNLLTDLGISTKITKGFAADEVEQIYRRAKVLCALLDDKLPRFACCGVPRRLPVRGEVAAGYASAQE
ncbi:MAG: hypothetical protein M9927_11435 [Anaerolineae bacterium]|nr:hypothetical protein [Anaerolineae bacterium]